MAGDLADLAVVGVVNIATYEDPKVNRFERALKRNGS
jgi:hypothetical protein